MQKAIDIRWIQRLDHFAKALSQLKEAVELAQQRRLSKLVSAILDSYYAEFEALRITLVKLKQEEHA